MELAKGEIVPARDRTSYRIIVYRGIKTRSILCISIITLLVITSAFAGMLFLTAPTSAKGPTISGTNLSYDALWDLDTPADLYLYNITLENGSAKLIDDANLKTFSGASDFLAGEFNGTILTEDNCIGSGFISDYNLTTGSGWKFESEPASNILSFHDPGSTSGVLTHTGKQVIETSELTVSSVTGTGLGTLIDDVLDSDTNYYSIDKGENITINGFNVTGMSGKLISVTVFTEYKTSNVYNGNYSMHIWNRSSSSYLPLNITPRSSDPPSTDLIRFDTLSPSLFSLYDTWSELSNLKLYWMNNCPQAAKNVDWNRIWLNVSYYSIQTMTYPGNTGYINYSFNKDYLTPNSPGEMELRMNYFVELAQYSMGSGFKIELNGNEITNMLLPVEGTQDRIIYDISSYMVSKGTYNLSIQLFMEYNTPDLVNCTFKVEDVQIIPRQASYVSTLYDTGSVTMWGQLAWFEKFILSDHNIYFETRTGDDLDTSHPSWSAWSGPLGEKLGTDIPSPPAKYIQYRIIYLINNPDAEARISTIQLGYNSYRSSGFVTTSDLSVFELTQWSYFEANYSKQGAEVIFEYSTDSGNIWYPVPANGSLLNVPIDKGKIMFKVSFSTPNTSITPVLFDFSVSYLTMNHKPTIPIMLFPPDMGYVDSLQPVFNWSESFDSDPGDSLTYTLYYSKDRSFSQDITEIKGITMEYYSPSAYLDDDSIYYWYVIAQDSHGAANGSTLSRSSVFIINTENDPPTTPQLLSPSNNSILYNDKLVFNWTDSSDPDFGDAVTNYTLEISTDPTFTNKIFIEKGITKSSYKLDYLLDNDLFYWHVEAVDKYGLTSGFQKVPSQFTLDIPYPTIFPVIGDLTTGEDFPYEVNLLDYVEQKYHSENLSWNLVGVDTTLFNWEIQNNGLLRITPMEHIYGHDTFEIELYHKGILRDKQELSITIQSINDPPEITPLIPDSLFRTIEGNSITIYLDNFASDVEDSLEELYWTVDDYNPDGYSILIENNPDMLYIDTTYNSSGVYMLSLFLWDSDDDFTTQDVYINITPLNHPPSIVNVPDLVLKYNENYYLDLKPYITDLDTPVNELKVMDSSDYVGFNPTQPLVAIFKFPESFMGELINVKFTVTDGQTSDFDEITVYVSDNNIPQKKEIPDISFNEDTQLTYAIDLDDYFYDTDGGLLEYYVFGNTYINLKIKKDNSVDFSAMQNWYGKETVIFRAKDSQGALVEDSIEITVYPVNDPPVLTITNLDIMEEIYTTLDLIPYIIDIDNDLENMLVNEDSDYITVDGLNLIFYYPVGVDFDIFTLSIFDGVDYTNRTIQVIIHPNQPPIIDEIPDLILHYDYGYKFNLQPYIFDPDNESEDLILKTDSSYITLDPHVPLLIIINYPESYLGDTISIKIDVSDGLLSTIGYFKVKISDDWTPELVRPLPNLVFMEDSMNLKVLDLNAYFTDKDDEVLNFKVKSDKVKVIIHENGYIDVTAEENWYGFESVTLGAIDEHGAFSEDTIRVQFSSINDPPEIMQIPEQNAKSNHIWTLYLYDYISDIDTPKDQLTITARSHYVEVSESTLFFNYPVNVTYEEVLITVSDGELTASRALVVRISNEEPGSKSFTMNSISLISIVIFILALIITFYNIFRSRKKQPANLRYVPGAEPADFMHGYRSMYRPAFNVYDKAGELEPEKGIGSNEGHTSGTDSPSDLEKKSGVGAASILAKELRSSHEIVVNNSNSYLIEEPKPDKTFEVFNSLIRKGFEGLCITRTHPNIVRTKYGVNDQPIIWLTSSKQVKNESYIPPPALSRISLVVSNFLQKKNQGVIVLEGFEFLLNRDDFKTVLKLIHFLNDLVITNKSILLIPIDPKILDESDLHLLERDCFIVHTKDKIVISSSLEVNVKPEK